MPDINFSVKVNPEVVKKFNDEKIDKLSGKYGLDKKELEGNGIGLTEADGMQLNTFKALSGGTGVITKATLIKFDDGNQTPAQKYSEELKKVLPGSMVVQSPKSNEENVINVQSRYGDTANQSFVMVGGNDSNKDGKLDVVTELNENELVKTTNDAKELGGKELKANPDQAMAFYLKKKGVNTSEITVTSNESKPLNTKLSSLLDGIGEGK